MSEQTQPKSQLFSRDLSLSSWGPYSQHYAGYSKVLQNGNGTIFDFIPLVGYDRGKTIVPDINFDSGYHMMEANSDLSYVRYRYDLQWKDVEYCDVEFFRADGGVYVRLTYANHSNYDKTYITSMLSVSYPLKRYVVELADGAHWIGAESYVSLSLANEDIQWKLGTHYEGNNVNQQVHMGKDGYRRGVTSGCYLVDGLGLGNLNASDSGSMGDVNRSFLFSKGTKVVFSLPEFLECGSLYVRLAAGSVQAISLKVSLNGSDYIVHYKEALAADDVSVLLLLKDVDTGGTLTLEVIDLQCGSEPQMVLDGLLFVPAEFGEDYAKTVFKPSIQGTPQWSFERPENEKGLYISSNSDPETGVYLLSEDERPRPPFPYSDATVTHIRHDELSGVKIQRKISNDSLFNWYDVNCNIKGNGKNHFIGYNIGPLVVEAGKERVVELAIACGESDLEELSKRAIEMLNEKDAIVCKVRDKRKPDVEVASLKRGMELLRSCTFSNVTYPVRIGEEVVRTYTPGKRWGGLFTWDSGMHGIGLAELEPARAGEILHQYFPRNETDEVPAVLHGTPLPLHVYLLSEIYRKTADLGLIKKYFRRALLYWSYFSGRHPASKYDDGKMGMLSSYSDGYNSQGVDDYPVQHFEGIQGLYPKVKTLSVTSHAIRTAKILREIGSVIDEDVSELSESIEYLSSGIQEYAWDPETTWFEHVFIDSKRRVKHPDGGSFNMGIDGVSPLLAGICNEEQEQLLLNHIMSPDEMWTPHGMTVVSQQAPYFRYDGYWNGKVWIPHQWFIWKTMLTLGRFSEARKLAETALKVFGNAADETYHSYELFDMRSGMGEGCHQFAGLSSPLLAFYNAYHLHGNVATGFDTLVFSLSDGDNKIKLISPVTQKIRGIVQLGSGKNLYIDGKQADIQGDSYELNLNLPECMLEIR